MAHAARMAQTIEAARAGDAGKGFAVVAMSDTPDPRLANNFAERVIPPDD